jgi:hypothetical protein
MSDPVMPRNPSGRAYAEGETRPESFESRYDRMREAIRSAIEWPALSHDEQKARNDKATAQRVKERDEERDAIAEARRRYCERGGRVTQAYPLNRDYKPAFEHR